MKKDIFTKNLIFLSSVDSTNKAAQEILENENRNENFVIVSNYQTAGRGQGRNHWESENGKNIIFSLLVFPDFLKAENQFYLLKAVSLGLVDYLSKIVKNIKIKWTNDIYVEDKKIAGILIENSIQTDYLSHSIIGVGLNLNQHKFHSNAPNPTSLNILTDKEFDINIEIEKLLESLSYRYFQLKCKEFSKLDDDYFKYLYLKNQVRKYKSDSGIIEAKIVRVNKLGQLLLQNNDGISEFNYGEIEFLL
ncbi:MAG: biotin--[acetyl-CoA-carboxylase] ligase [Bacteroidetes bacterium]|jgi:BirA family transcriptional regulator, biotin operon repressor / biotin---[acetyl-CoA-carboxylase] ligase|nr:biotin--[acetyl-CoA-carboxylase] ligase [Bacteroidota bacterium]MBT6685920.1 biotin--[acetyl-CoA-carboxylase] ligase [Bacteroidota bacterium]MBT7143139.1 biotin--[acetyl-CoA-carboxylase] ligase [Bacteroidota bacterium]MBT7491665.1 biotin--[acetyl-CoA-carboxylase] ligase [Bacteroidota bacterium]